MPAPAEPGAPPGAHADEAGPSEAGRARVFDRSLLVTAAVLGAIGVAAGAFGAHALGTRVSPSRLATFETGVRYMMLHVPVLLVLAVVLPRHERALLRWSGSLFVGGTVVFTGSLFLLVLLDLPWMGAITPIGGSLLIAGWVCLAVAGVRAGGRGPAGGGRD